jgi:uncharacterized BrkB/YihY/UPF0761 family membrane protein
VIQINKKLVGATLAIIVTGTVVMSFLDPRWLGNVLRSYSGMSPRVQTLVAMPFVITLIVIGYYFFKFREERKWKKAILSSRANKEKEAVMKAAKND